MYKITLRLAMMLLLTSCSLFSENYTMDVTYPTDSYNHQTVYIYENYTNFKIDSAFVVDKKAHFSGSIKQPKLAYIQSGSGVVPFVLETGDYTLDVETKTIAGSALTATLTAFNDRLDALSDQAELLYEQLSQDKSLDSKAMADTYNQALDSVIMPAMKKEALTLFEQNKNNVLAIAALEALEQMVSPEEYKALVYGIGPSIINEDFIIDAQQVVIKNSATKEGAQFVDFTGIDAAGNEVNLSDYVGKGNYVLVDFWASWCGPCLGEVPNLKAIYEKYKDNNFELVGIAVWDELEASKNAIEKDGMMWPQILNTDKVATDAYSIRGIPEIILFGPDGTILKRGLRGEQIGEELAKVLK